MLENHHEPIVSKEVFEKAQSLQIRYTKKSKFDRETTLLGGYVKCGNCRRSLTCIAGENAIKFDLKEIIPLPYKEYVDRRIGRLLPPYITKVQQNSSQYIVREGLMPVPEELYSDFGASDC